MSDDTDTVSADSVAELAAVYEEWFGEPAQVEPCGDDVQIHRFEREDDGGTFSIYLTAGMSLGRMELPDDAVEERVPARAEYVFYAREPDDRYVDMLRLLVVFPFVDHTFVYGGHTVMLAEPIDDAGTLVAVLLLNTLFRGHARAFDSLRVAGEPVNVLWPVPITLAERTLKQQRGVDAVLDLLAAHANPPIFPGARDSYC